MQRRDRITLLKILEETRIAQQLMGEIDLDAFLDNELKGE